MESGDSETGTKLQVTSRGCRIRVLLGTRFFIVDIATLFLPVPAPAEVPDIATNATPARRRKEESVQLNSENMNLHRELYILSNTMAAT
jgi:hypothetical protein